jgi:hypothetical protein
MANFTAGTSFTDGVTNDVTAAKLNALVADAVPTSSLALASTSGTISNFTSSTATLLGAITGSTNVINIGSGQIYKDASGNIGIGTSSPATKLHISGAGTTSGSYTNGDAVGQTLYLQDTGNLFGNGGQILFGANQGVFAGIKSSIVSGTGPAGNLIFQTRDTSGNVLDRMVVTREGLVGIGTTSPAKPLTVKADSVDGVSVRLIANGNEDVVLDLFNAAGTTQKASIESDVNSALKFKTVNTERLRIDSSGNVGIGMTPTAQLELSTDSAKKPSTNTWTIASDQRLKTNITNADNDRCYEIVKQVPLKRYTWKSEVYSQEKVKDRSKLGWIAQDVEEVFPKAVGTSRFAYNQVFEDVVTPELDSDGNAVLDENGVAKTKTEKRLVSEDVIEDCKDLNSDQIYAAMYGTIQKLIEKVEFLESKVATLEAA